MSRFLMILVGLGLSVCSGCGGEATSGGSPHVVGTPTSQPFPPELRVLAEQLAVDMKASPNDFRDNVPLAQTLANLQATVLALQQIQSTDPAISAVAEKGLSVVKQLTAGFERLNALPKPPSSGEIFADSFIHGLYGNLFTPYARALEADEQQRAIIAELQGLIAAVDQWDAVHLLLPQLVSNYAASPTTGSTRFQADIDEPWGGLGGPDWLHVYNSGAALDDCLVEVELVGATGEVRRNVHFVRRWPAQTWMSARYKAGQEFLGRVVDRRTVTQIQSATVRIWSPQFTTSIAYAYRGAERDKDIAKTCERLKVTGRYIPFQAGVLWNTRRGGAFTLQGLPELGTCQATVTFRKGWQTKGFTWDFSSWRDGEEKRFRPTEEDLTFDPNTIDLSISFPDSSYHHKATLNVRR